MKYRVWPDGTVQDASEEPYNWMSDDYLIVEAENEYSFVLYGPSLSCRAMQFAQEQHAKQVRKYTGEPYFKHLAEVAGLVSTVVKDYPYRKEEMLATAWLHDYVEDINPATGLQILSENFGPEVAAGVCLLSNLNIGTRKDRKREECSRLAIAPGWIQSIKCADIISNTSSIVLHDPEFAVTYLQEKNDILDVMEQAHPVLRKLARNSVGARR